MTGDNSGTQMNRDGSQRTSAFLYIHTPQFGPCVLGFVQNRLKQSMDEKHSKRSLKLTDDSIHLHKNGSTGYLEILTRSLMKEDSPSFTKVVRY